MDLSAALLDQMSDPQDADIARLVISVEFGTLLASAIPFEADSRPLDDPVSYRFRLAQPETRPGDDGIVEAIRVSSLYFVLRPTHPRFRASAAIQFTERSGAGERVRRAIASLATAMTAGHFFEPMLELYEVSLFDARSTPSNREAMMGETESLYSAAWKSFTESVGWEAFDPHGYWIVPSAASLSAAWGEHEWR